MPPRRRSILDLTVDPERAATPPVDDPPAPANAAPPSPEVAFNPPNNADNLETALRDVVESVWDGNPPLSRALIEIQPVDYITVGEASAQPTTEGLMRPVEEAEGAPNGDDLFGDEGDDDEDGGDDEATAHCHHCEVGLWEEVPRETPDGDPVCARCWRVGYFLCRACQCVAQLDEQTDVRAGIDSTPMPFCGDCASERSHMCEACGQYYLRSDYLPVGVGCYITRDVRFHEQFQCLSCRPASVNGRRGDTRSILFMDRTRLPNRLATTQHRIACGRREPSGQIMQYSWKPDPVFHDGDGCYRIAHPSRLYIGFELEFTREQGTKPVLNMCNEIAQPYWYFKRDGSIGDNGAELVTDPLSQEVWTNPEFQSTLETALRKLRVSGYRSFDSSHPCGLHVHMSRSAFAGRLHLYRFMRLIYGNPLFARRIAESSDTRLDRWCAIQKDVPTGAALAAALVTKTKTGKGRNGRYAAVNLIPKHTVEVRMFRGTLRYESLCKGIEFCIAAHEFSGSVSLAQCNSAFFKRWLLSLESKSAYPHLRAFLSSKATYVAEGVA